MEYLELASRGRNAWWRYLLSPLLAVVAAVLLLASVIAALMLMGIAPPDLAAQIQKPRHVVPFYLGIAGIFGALALGLLLAVRLLHGKRFRDLVGRWRWGFFAYGFAVWLVVMIALSLVDVAIAPGGFSVSASRETMFLAFAALVGIGIQTFSEELIFRGYVTQGILLALKKPLIAAVVSGLFFGMVHIPNGIPQALNAAVFGIVCAMLAIRTGSIALTSGLHLANNYFGAALLVSGSDVFQGSPGLFTQNTPHLMWWDLCLSVLGLIGVTWLFFKRPYFAGSSEA